MKTLVVTATGALAGEICKRLINAGHQVRGLVRQGSAKEAEIKALGVEVVHGDLLEPASLKSACNGVEAVIGTASAILTKGSKNTLKRVDEQGFVNLIAAAKEAGVKKFVYVSVSPNLPDDAPLVAAKRAVEKALTGSGMDWTILQPMGFIEVWFGPALGWDLKGGVAQVFGEGKERSSWVSLEDVATYAVTALGNPKSSNRRIPLGGPEALSVMEVVKLAEEVTGRRFKVKRMPGVLPRVLKTVLKPINPKIASLMAFGVDTMNGDVIEMAALQKEFGIPGTTVREYVRRMVS